MFVLLLTINILLIWQFPTLSPSQKLAFDHWPKDGHDLERILEVIQVYSEDHFMLVLVSYVSIYIK